MWKVGNFVKLINNQLTFLVYRLLFRGSESYLYYYIYQNFRICNLAWNHPVTWYLAALGVDFCYYWVHRACHGILHSLIVSFIFFNTFYCRGSYFMGTTPSPSQFRGLQLVRRTATVSFARMVRICECFIILTKLSLKILLF